MVEKHVTPLRNVIDLTSYRQVVASGRAMAMPARTCRHCGAPLLDGETDDDCSTAFSMAAPRLREQPRRFRAD